MRTKVEPSRLRKIASFAAAVVATLSMASASAEEPKGTAGAEKCRECHEDVFARFEKNVHAGKDAARRLSARPGCESCHGEGAAHAEDPSQRAGLVTFGEGSEAESIRACLSCHSKESAVTGYARGSHGRNRIACNECHASPHAESGVSLRRSTRTGEESSAELGRHLRKSSSELCLDCHEEMRGRLTMPYRHPLGEKAIGCVDCHNPHRDVDPNPRAKNAMWFSCHEDKRGPWPFEHAPVAEECGTCHDPHGSVAPRLLTTAQPFLCLSCHALPDDRHGTEIGGTQFSRAIYGQCTSCHGAIHGSHEDRHLKK